MKSFKNEFLFGKTGAGFSSIFFIILFIVGLALGQLIVMLLSVLLLFLAFSRKGVRIDIENKRVQEFTSTFIFFKFGKWYESSDYKNFQIGNKSSSGTIAANIAMQTSYEITSKAIYLRNSVNRDVVMLMNGEKEEVNEIANLLEHDLLIPRRTKLKAKKRA